MYGSIGGGGGGVRGSGPLPRKSQVVWGSIEISIGTPPLENVGPPLDPWKNIVFYVIKPLDPLLYIWVRILKTCNSISMC